MTLEEELKVKNDLLRRAMDIITNAIMHGMPITEEVAAVRNAIVVEWGLVEIPEEASQEEVDSLINSLEISEELAEVMDSVIIPEWLETPNSEFGGRKPQELIDNGELDSLRELIYRLKSGMPG